MDYDIHCRKWECIYIIAELMQIHQSKDSDKTADKTSLAHTETEELVWP